MRTVHELSPIPTPPYEPHDSGRFELFSGQTTIDHATWLPTDTSPGVISVVWEGRPHDEVESELIAKVPYGRVKTAVALADLGLREAMETIGFRVEHVDQAKEGKSFYTLLTPNTRDAVAAANSLEYPPELGRRMRFDIFEPGGRYSQQNMFLNLKRGIMLLSSERDPNESFHDVVDHMLVGLAMTDEMLDTIAAHVEQLETRTDLLENQREAHIKYFMGQYDYLMYGPTFVKFLNQDRGITFEWAALLGLDPAVTMAWSQRARHQLSQLRVVGTNFQTPEISSRRESWVPRQVRRVLGGLGLGQTVR